MSQMTSTARVGARSLNRPASPTPRLRVVTGAPLRRGRALFVILCATLLGAGLIGLLMLNTALAQGSFALHDLRTTSEELTEAQDALNQSLAASQSSASLAKRAANLGLVPAQSSVFLRLSDGKVIGVAKAAPAGPGFTVVGTTSVPASAASKPAGKVAPKPAKTAVPAPPRPDSAAPARPEQPARR